jgi:FkbM family methyltransferase
MPRFFQYYQDRHPETNEVFTVPTRDDFGMITTHEQGTLGLLEIQENDVFIDVGANLGSVSIHAAKQGASVIAIEPVLDNYLCLFYNTLAYPQIKTLQCAVGAQKDFLPLNISKYSGWSSFVEPSYTLERCEEVVDRGFIRKENVPVLPLSFILRKAYFSRVDWIKIDTEGFEKEVLLGSKEIIADFRPKILIEVHSINDGNIIEGWLTEWEYVIFKQYDPLNVSKMDNYHILAEPSEKQSVVPLMNFEKAQLMSSSWIYREVGKEQKEISFEDYGETDMGLQWQLCKGNDNRSLIVFEKEAYHVIQKTKTGHWETGDPDLIELISI